MLGWRRHRRACISRGRNFSRKSLDAPSFSMILMAIYGRKKICFFAKKVGGAEFAAILTIQFSRGLHAALTLAYVPEPSVFPRVYCSSSGFPRLSTGTLDRCSDSREPRESKLCEEVISPHFVP